MKYLYIIHENLTLYLTCYDKKYLLVDKPKILIEYNDIENKSLKFFGCDSNITIDANLRLNKKIQTVALINDRYIYIDVEYFEKEKKESFCVKISRFIIIFLNASIIIILLYILIFIYKLLKL